MPELATGFVAPYLASASSAQLSIPAGLLSAGACYRFSVIAAAADGSSSSNATAVVCVTPGELSVVVANGTARLAAVESAVTLTAVASDPGNTSDVSGARLPFTFRWSLLSCPSAAYPDARSWPTVDGGTRAPACHESRLFPRAVASLLHRNASSLTLPAASLAVGTYLFRVTVSKPPRSASTGLLRTASASVAVTLVAQASLTGGAIYDVTVADVAAASSFDVRRVLRLSCGAALAGVPQYGAVAYEWTAADAASSATTIATLLATSASLTAAFSSSSSSSSSSSASSSANATTDASSSTSSSSTSSSSSSSSSSAATSTAALLSLASGTLAPGHKYVFTCCTPSCASAAGRASATIVTRTGPTSGSVSLVPNSGVLSSLTVFSLAARNWVPPMGLPAFTPLCYQFSFSLNGGSEMALGDPSPAASFTAIFPVGTLGFYGAGREA